MPAVVEEREPLVIEAEEVEDRRVDVGHGHRIGDAAVGDFVGLAVVVAGARPVPGQMRWASRSLRTVATWRPPREVRCVMD